MVDSFANETSAANGDVTDEGTSSRQRSSIPFPYISLPDVVEMADVVYRRGHRCKVDEIAADLKQQTTSGAFRSRLSAGRMFGVIDVVRRDVSLTDLGLQIVQPDTRADALVDAFLNVDLYEKIYRTFAGGKLPPDLGIEQEMSRLGLPSKQVQKARQVMFRSAEEAGFFRNGRDRLVSPPRSSVAPGSGSPSASVGRQRAGTEAIPMAEHPLIKGLVAKLPPEGERYTQKQRQRWLDAAKVNLELIYATEDEEDEEYVAERDVLPSPNGVATEPARHS